MQGLCSPPSWAGCIPTCDGHGHWGGSGADCRAARYEPALPTGACLVPKLSPPHGRGCLLRGKCRELLPAWILPAHAEKPVLSVLCLCTARNRHIPVTCGRLSRTIPCPYTAAMLWLCFWLQFGQHRQLCFVFFTIPAVQHTISARLPRLQSRCMAPHHRGCHWAGWTLTGGPLVHKVSPTLRSSLRPFNSVFLELLVSCQQSLMQTEGHCESQAGIRADEAEPGAGLLFFG